MCVWPNYATILEILSRYDDIKLIMTSSRMQTGEIDNFRKFK